MNPRLRIWHPFTQEALDPPPIHVAHAQGAYLYTGDGRRLIDAISSWWVNIHGHCHPAIMDALFAQTKKIDHVLLAGFTHEGVEELCGRLNKYLPSGLENIFFSDNGSTAVEVALKMAVQYWQNVGRPEKRSIISLEHAYHGDTVGAMSVSAPSSFTDPFRALMFDVHRVPSPHSYRASGEETPSPRVADCVAAFEQLLREKHGEIAVMIVEPLLQGAGGMVVHPVEFLQRLRGLCTEYEVLLIADEVLTGFGRTGKMFACDVAGVAPDIICLSKGLTGGALPMGATVCTRQIHDAFVSEDRMRTFFHGHSYTGNPLAAAAAVASLGIFENEPVFERIAAIAGIHQERLPALQKHPAVADVRSIGTVAAIELRADDAGYFSNVRPKLYQFFLDAGILLRPLGNVVYILPPYVISEGDLHYIYDQIGKALDLFTDGARR